MSNPCLLCSIVNGHVPTAEVDSAENIVSVMDIRPIRVGHVLVIPRVHAPSVYELSDSEYISLMLYTKVVASAMEQAYSPLRVAQLIVGCEVAHAHVHLVPVSGFSDLQAEPDGAAASSSAIRQEAVRIRTAIKAQKAI